MSQLLEIAIVPNAEVTMSQQSLDVALMSDAEVTRSCHSSQCPLLSDPTCSNKVIRLSPDAVIKFGPFVARGGYLN